MILAAAGNEDNDTEVAAAPSPTSNTGGSQS